MTHPDPTQRFSDRVENYVKYRPGYPAQTIPFLAQAIGLRPDSVIADVGSGTGILTGLFLRNGNPVFAVEPNKEMRAAAERLLAGYPDFTSLDGTAEAIPLPDHSVDFVTAGQAFHWFDAAKARAEFGRVLQPGGWVVLIWNDRRLEVSEFSAAYEALLQRYATDYRHVNHQNLDEAAFTRFFGSGGYKIQAFENVQYFDLAGFTGRLLSSSYAPLAGHPAHAPMLAELPVIFERYQRNGQVSFEYQTQVYYGQLE